MYLYVCGEHARRCAVGRGGVTQQDVRNGLPSYCTLGRWRASSIGFKHDHVIAIPIRYGVLARYVLVKRPVTERDRLAFFEHADVVLRHHKIANQSVRDSNVQLRRDVAKLDKLILAQPVALELVSDSLGNLRVVAK